MDLNPCPWDSEAHELGCSGFKQNNPTKDSFNRKDNILFKKIRGSLKVDSSRIG